MNKVMVVIFCFVLFVIFVKLTSLIFGLFLASKFKSRYSYDWEVAYSNFEEDWVVTLINHVLVGVTILFVRYSHYYYPYDWELGVYFIVFIVTFQFVGVCCHSSIIRCLDVLSFLGLSIFQLSLGWAIVSGYVPYCIADFCLVLVALLHWHCYQVWELWLHYELEVKSDYNADTLGFWGTGALPVFLYWAYLYVQVFLLLLPYIG